MIVYKELSSLKNDLGISAKALYTASNSADKHYKKITTPKKDGGVRELSVPDNFLKAIQHRIRNTLLIHEKISPYATAYRLGGSPLVNAKPHLGKEKILKLDIKGFFDAVIYPLVKEKAFPEIRYSEQNRILLTLICMHNEALPQGAPTSPAISNIIMKDFDNTVGDFCKNMKVTYTRYCDDMTFSGSFDEKIIEEFVKNELHKMGFFLNEKKTVVAENGRRKTVTGIVVNDKLNVSSSYRRKIRQELYYITSYGLSSHIERLEIKDVEKYLLSLLGRINYVLSVAKTSEFEEYKKTVLKLLKKPPTETIHPH